MKWTGRSLLVWVGVLALTVWWNGCAKKPNLQELQQLEEQRRSIVEQEKKLLELKTEREKLEAALEDKKNELRKLETERDSLKGRLGQ